MKKNGFTLIELVVFTVLFGILVWSVTATWKIREKEGPCWGVLNSVVLGDIVSEVRDSRTVYLIRISGYDKSIVGDSTVSSELPFAKAGDIVSIKFSVLVENPEIRLKEFRVCERRRRFCSICDGGGPDGYD